MNYPECLELSLELLVYGAVTKPSTWTWCGYARLLCSLTIWCGTWPCWQSKCN